MKKLLMAMILGTILVGTTTARAESIWNKGVVARYDYTKYATWLATQLKVDYGVWPTAWGHSGGAVYTDDGWQSVLWAEGRWEKNIQGPFGGWDEAWTVYIGGGGENGQYMGQQLVPFSIEYALYVKNSAGQWSWDNNRGMNYKYDIN